MALVVPAQDGPRQTGPILDKLVGSFMALYFVFSCFIRRLGINMRICTSNRSLGPSSSLASCPLQTYESLEQLRSLSGGDPCFYPNRPSIFSGGVSYVFPLPHHFPNPRDPSLLVLPSHMVPQLILQQRLTAHIHLQLHPSDGSPSMAMLLRVSFATIHCLQPRRICLGQNQSRFTLKVPPCHVHPHSSNGSTLSPS